MSFFDELKRRNVFRVGAAYLVASWLIVQLVETIFPAFGFGDAAVRNVVILLAAGLLPALILAWAFEITSEGVKREKEVDRSLPGTTLARRKFNRALIVLLVLALSFFVFDKFVLAPNLLDFEPDSPSSGVSQGPQAAQSQSVAVLPFVAMSRGEDDEYFADGLTEEILNSLASLPELLVTARTSSFHFKGTDLPIPEIAATLGVSNVVEGSVRRDGERVRITAQLIRAADGFHLWSQTYDRTLEDVFAVQEDIAQNIAEVLDVVLDDSTLARMSGAGIGNVEAFIAYQKGSEAFNAAHVDIEHVSEALAGANIWFDEVLASAPQLNSVRLMRADLAGHQLIELAAGFRPESRPGEGAEIIDTLLEEYSHAWESAQPGLERTIVEVERTLFSDDWSGLSAKLDKALAGDECSTGNWINQLGSPYGWAQRLEQRSRNNLRCDPLSGMDFLALLNAQIWSEKPLEALQTISEAEALNLKVAYMRDFRLVALLAAKRFSEDPQVYTRSGHDTIYPFPDQFMLKASEGDSIAARQISNEYLARSSVDDWSALVAAAATGNLEAANMHAARIDARPGGPFLLVQATQMCFCGAPFDIDATPNFKARIKEAGFPWPPSSPIDYPLKTW